MTKVQEFKTGEAVWVVSARFPNESNGVTGASRITPTVITAEDDEAWITVDGRRFLKTTSADEGNFFSGIVPDSSEMQGQYIKQEQAEACLAVWSQILLTKCPVHLGVEGLKDILNRITEGMNGGHAC